jgi:hypothetical protein
VEFSCWCGFFLVVLRKQLEYTGRDDGLQVVDGQIQYVIFVNKTLLLSFFVFLL